MKKKLNVIILLIVILASFSVATEATTLETFLDIVMEHLSFTRGEIAAVESELTDIDSVGISDKQIGVYLNGQLIGADTTDSSGEASYQIDTSSMEPGVYLLAVDFAGDTESQPSHDSALMTIEGDDNVQYYATEATVTEQSVQEIERCKITTVEREEPIIGTCLSNPRTETVCTDEPINDSCSEVTESYEFTCRKGMQIIEEERQDCTTTGYLINNAVRLNTEEYGCLIEESGGTLTVICDSVFDGNGDGICKSGESCIQFVLDGGSVSRSFKNSRKDFVEDDPTFFLQKATSEVVS